MKRSVLAAVLSLLVVCLSREAVAAPFSGSGGANDVSTTSVNGNAPTCSSDVSFNIWDDPQAPGTLRISGSIGITWDSNPVYFYPWGIAGTVTRSGDTITVNFDNSSTELHPAIGTITLTKQAGASAWTGTISFSCYSFWGQPYQVLNATGGGAITFTQAQSQQFLWWQNVINDWKSDNASLGAAIKQLKADHSQKMWEYARIGFDSPPDFDDVYEIRYAPPTKLYPGGRKKAIITKRGSGRSALVRLNQAFLTLSDAWSKVKIGGNLSLDLANGSLKNSTLTSIGLESYEIPDDVLGVAATISKLAIYEGKAYKPISAIKRDIASYNRSKQSAANALRLMRSNIDRVGSLTSKIVEGLEKEAVAFRTNIETDTLLTNDEKDELKGLLLVRLLELTGI